MTCIGHGNGVLSFDATYFGIQRRMGFQSRVEVISAFVNDSVGMSIVIWHVKIFSVHMNLLF